MELRRLAATVGQRMRDLGQVPPVEWESFKTVLFADDDHLAAGMKRLGLTLEDLGWTLSGPGCRWQRIEPAARETLFDVDEATEDRAGASPWK